MAGAWIMSFEFPSANNLNNLIRTNRVLPSLNEATESLNTGITALTTSASGIVSQITSLRSTITTQVDNLLQDIQQPVRNLQDEMSAALLVLQSDPNRFEEELATIQTHFPSFDVNSILPQISDGTLDIAVDIPNINIINGEEVTMAIRELRAQIPPITIPEFPTLPTITIPEFPTPNELDVEELAVNANGVLQFSSTSEELGHRLAVLRRMVS